MSIRKTETTDITLEKTLQSYYIFQFRPYVKPAKLVQVERKKSHIFLYHSNFFTHAYN